MKKALSILIVLALVCGGLFAQGAQETAANKLNLVIYSAGTEEETQTVADAFVAKYPNVSYTIIQVGSSDLVTRVKTEWPKPEGDVVFLLGAENLDQITDKLHAYTVKNDAAYEAGSTKEANNLYYAMSMPLQAIMYNTDLLKGDMVPTSWADFADPKYNGMIELANPATSGSAYAQLFQMNQLYGWDFVKQVAANGITFVSSSTKGPTDVARGEFALTLTGEANIAQAIADGAHVAYVHPAEGTGLRTEGCGILENCANLEAAQLFMEFITSVEGEKVVASVGRRPVLADAGTPANLPELKDMKFYEYNNDEAKANKKQMQADFGALL